jgi:pimeloyl-ACP methyl ester carboxylesterase
VPFLERDGCSIHYEVRGDGEPVVLLHGFTSSFRRNWVGTGWVAALVGCGRRVVGLDLRGHGESSKPHHPERYETAELARDVAAVMDAAAGPAADVVAFSMGAGVALRLAMDEPQRVRRLALGGIGDAALRGHGDPAIVRALVEALTAAQIADVPAGPARQVRQFADEATNDLAALAALPARGGWPGDLEDPVAVEAPVLLLIAAADQFMHGHERLLELLPNAEVVRLAAPSHGAIVRDPAARDAVLRFLERPLAQ